MGKVAFWGGVDLFFCVSGYVVSRSFVDMLDEAKQRGTQWNAIKAFWVRRAFRLMPSAWLWLGITLVFACTLNSTGVFGDPSLALRGTVAVTTISANFAQAFGIQLLPNWVYWSLSLEEQFYFLFPFLLLATSVAWRWKLLLIGIAIQFPMIRTYWVDLAWFVRIDAMLWGVLIYLFSKRSEYRVFEPISLRNKTAACTVTILLLAGILMVPVMLKQLPFSVGLLALICAAMVLLASYAHNYILPIPAVRPVLLWMGSRSYAIYLIHTPMFYLTHELWSRWAAAKGLPPPGSTYTLRYAICAVVLTAIFTELNYRLVETPLRRKGVQMADAVLLRGDRGLAVA